MSEIESNDVQGEREPDIDPAPVDEATPYDALAREMGWFPRSDYKGDPEKWRAADEYIKQGVKSTKALKRDLQEVKKTADRLARTSASITERALAEQRAELEAAHDHAVDLGDRRAAREVAGEIARLDLYAADQQSHDADFARDNPWYGVNEEATAYAVSVSQRLAGQGKSVDDQLEQAAAAVEKRFPELFDEQSAKKVAPRVGVPTMRGSSFGLREKGFNDLPADAKLAWANFDKSFKARGVEAGYPKEEYVKDYFENAS